jgi:hypothetical protein
MGVDGIANTADDIGDPYETMVFPGPDGYLGTLDDQTRTLTEFQRKIEISNVMLPDNTLDPDIRQITVEVRFLERGAWRSVTVSSFISRYA